MGSNFPQLEEEIYSALNDNKKKFSKEIDNIIRHLLSIIKNSNLENSHTQKEIFDQIQKEAKDVHRKSMLLTNIPEIEIKKDDDLEISNEAIAKKKPRKSMKLFLYSSSKKDHKNRPKNDNFNDNIQFNQKFISMY